MPSPFDPSDFEDHEYKASSQAGYPSAGSAQVAQSALTRPPTREEVDHRVGEMQQRLADLKRAQDQLERERAGLEETRRRQAEFENSRAEMLEQLTRGIGLLEEAEVDARREVDAMAAGLADLRLALEKVQGLREENWSSDNFQLELTRALTTLEHARMEWNSVRVKFPVVERTPEEQEAAEQQAARAGNPFLQPQDWPQLFRLGMALTWPLVLLGIAICVLLGMNLGK
ncbi:MAG TPA: hypothetical protein DCY13_14810 [Verrucomicrobiales bacterium]|nr:hypothetical protein [Verrucomicrobiales bacterium]